MSDDEKLAHHLKMKFGLRPGEPTTSQLAAIKKYIQSLKDRGLNPTHSDWHYAVKQNCPSAGTAGYAGVDMSDLNALLTMASAPPKRS